MKQQTEFSTQPYFLILGAMLAAMVAHAMYYYPLMPDIVAQKYDFNGKPFRWGSKESMMAIYMGVALIPLILLTMVTKLPMNKMNFPNSEYWMHEDRIQKARTVFVKAMFSLGLAQGLFMFVIMDMMFKQNLEQGNMSEYLIPLLVVFITFMIVWMIRLFASFRIPDEK